MDVHVEDGVRDLLRRPRLSRWAGRGTGSPARPVGYGYRPAVALLWLLGTPAVPAWAFATLFVAGFTGLVRKTS